jgi:hypothetical protein
MIKKLSYAEAVEKANCKSFCRQAELEKQYECALKDWSKIAKHLPNPASAERDISRAYKFSFGFFTLVAGIPEGVWKMLWLDKRNEIAAGFQDLNNVSHADSLSTGMNCNIFAEALAGSYIKLRDPKASLACYFESAMFLKGWRSVGHRSMEKFTPPLRKIEHALILNIPKEYSQRVIILSAVSGMNLQTGRKRHLSPMIDS